MKKYEFIYGAIKADGEKQAAILKADGIAQARILEAEGTSEAIKKIANAIKRNRLGIRDTKRPLGVFLFTGPTRRWQNRVSKSSCK